MLRAYKYRIYPAKEQLPLLEQHFGSCRFVYNLALETKKLAYSGTKHNLSRMDLQKQLVDLKDECDWLWDINSQSLQSQLFNLEKAYINFFEHRAGFPKFKKKHGWQSFQCPQNVEIDFKKSLLYLPKFNSGIPIILHRPFKGIIKTVTIKKTPTNKYFASILIENGEKLPAKPNPEKERSIGIDRNLLNFAMYGNTERNLCEEIPNPKYLFKQLELLARAQKNLSRKKKGSKNREKARLKVARKYEKITNQRDDFVNKYSYRLVVRDSQSNTICMEDLNVRGMMSNHCLARAIADAGWSKFAESVQYKSDWYGKNVLFSPRFAPTSKRCKCGYIHDGLTLKDRIWICPKCNIENVRDILAFDNIIDFAFEDYYKKNRDGLPESTLGEFSPLSSGKSRRKAGTLNQEKFRKSVLRIAS